MRPARPFHAATPTACLAASLLIVASGLSIAVQPASAADQCKLLFTEDFHDLDVSPHGPGTRWIAHTPWGGDFGDAAFADPLPDFPFRREDGVFAIELRKNPAGKWQSGLLASQDSSGNGFARRYGYFEMRAKFPRGPGLWPAFWLDSMPPKTSQDPSTEIDVVEHYGKFPAAYNSTVTVWPKGHHEKARWAMHINHVPANALSTAFHSYGVEVKPDWIIFYLDRVEMWRTATPPEHKYPLMVLLNLGLGGGWPIDETPSPSWMYVDYVKVFSDGPSAGCQAGKQ